MVNVLNGAAAAEFHCDPQFLPPQIRAKILDNVEMLRILQHVNLLLDEREVVARLELDDLDGAHCPAHRVFRLVHIAIRARADPTQQVEVVLRVSPRNVAQGR